MSEGSRMAILAIYQFFLLQVRHCLEKCKLCSNLGVSTGRIWADSKIWQPWF